MKQREAAAAAAEAQNAERLAGLVETERAQQGRAAELDARSSDLAAHQQRLDVAASALAERETKISAREAAASTLEAKLERDAAALAAKVETYRKALAG